MVPVKPQVVARPDPYLEQPPGWFAVHLQDQPPTPRPTNDINQWIQGGDPIVESGYPSIAVRADRTLFVQSLPWMRLNLAFGSARHARSLSGNYEIQMNSE
jgi:hypothetical protein